jgi:transposase-like protein
VHEVREMVSSPNSKGEMMSACNHIDLKKQTGPMDGGIKSTRYVCQGCGESFQVKPASIGVSYGKPKEK